MFFFFFSYLVFAVNFVNLFVLQHGQTLHHLACFIVLSQSNMLTKSLMILQIFNTFLIIFV